ncbi:MAG TPA: proprotein convertase P-domain-containing protein, partial [Flavobacteriales bacterium]|nr:proprotein convertase P-domain-containing protein [Flavobacteriales bacterium]
MKHLKRSLLVMLCSWSLGAMAQPGSTCGTFTNSPNLAIVDNSTVTDIITTGPQGGQEIADLNVYLDITHTWNSDVTVELLSPQGTNITLFGGICGSSDNMTVELDDEAIDPVGFTCPPVGVFAIPTGALSGFDGEVFEGDWTLSVSDGATGDPGTLNSWCLIPTLVPPPACTDPVATAAVVETDCATGTFTVEVDLTDLSGASSVDITADVNGGGATVVHDDVTALQVYVLGPYTNGDVVNVAVLHNDDNACDLPLGNWESSLTCVDAGVCAQNRSIPDNACPALTDYTIEISGAPGTVMGVDVNFASVDLIIAHTWQSDLDVSLTSPGGVTVPLFAGVGGSADNVGDPGNCPTAVCTFADGGAAYAGGANVTGVFSAASALAAFNDGITDPNGAWTLSICDGASGDLGSVEYVQLNFVVCTPPTVTAPALVADCGNGQFFADIEVTDFGTATSLTIDDGTTTQQILSSGGVPQTVQMGPYPSGTTVTFDVIHDQDNGCSLTAYGSLGFVCPVEIPVIAGSPYCQDFEAATLCTTNCFPATGCLTSFDPINWLQGTGDNGNWSVDEGGTGSTGTGPVTGATTGQSDFVPGTTTGNYAYLESSGSCNSANNAFADLLSPSFNISGMTSVNGYRTSFAWHMLGNAAMVLQVDVREDFGAWQTIFTNTGSAGPQWNEFTTDRPLGATTVQYRFRAVSGTSFDSDVTIDYVCISEAPLCTSPIATAAVVETDCTTGTFTVEVDLTDLGDASNVDITADVNGGGATVDYDDVNALQIYVLGPYNIGDVVDVAVLHNGDPVCDLDLGSYQSALFCAFQSTCALGLAIPDNSCATPTDMTVPATAPGTQLGTDVILQSVDVIVQHTFNADIEMSLTSPNGVTVLLIADRFGSGDNLGNPANCPTDVMTFVDGGAALTTTATSNVTGNWAPEASLTGFNDGSDPNGDWVLTICDDLGGDLGTVQYIQLNFADCIQPAASGLVVETDCLTGTFTIDLDLTDLGSATDVDIEVSVNGGTPSVAHDDVSTLQIYALGPFNNGETVDVTVVHNQNALCNLNAGTYASGLGCAPVEVCGLNLAIPDASCPTTTPYLVPVSAPGTSMGTDVFVANVQLVVSHTWNSDLEISLTSPNAVTVPLVIGSFGSGDNLGIPANCPTDLFTLADGGAAQTTTATSNVVGVFDPNTPLTTFEDGSDPNGLWTLNICDAVGGDVGALQYIDINFVTCALPTASASSVDDCGNGQFNVSVDIVSLGSSPSFDVVATPGG